MLRSTVSKVMWVGRATVFLVGLAVILALVIGVASAAFGANGDAFLLGKRNVASAVSTLTKRGAGPALRLHVGSGAPLAVNSSKQVANLNADKLDGKDVSQIGVRGLERVSVDSPLGSSASPKQQTLDCPAGKVMLSSGYDLAGGKTGNAPNALSDLVVDVIQPTTNAQGQTTGVLIEAYEIAPTADTWNIRVFAVCATAPS